MNIIHSDSKTIGCPQGFSFPPGGGFVRRSFYALLAIIVWFVLANGGGIGPDKAYAVVETFERYVLASSDDAEEDTGGGMDLTSSDLELVTESTVQQVGMRFQNITIEQGAVISNAYIEFACDETGPTEATSLTFRGQAHNNPVTFSVDNNITNRARTSASVVWDISAQWTTTHERHRSPDLAPIIQEIVDRSGWTSGNAMVIIVTGYGKRVAESWNGANSSGDLTLAPKLHIEYEGGSDSGNKCRIYYRGNKQAQADSTNSLPVDMPSADEGDLLIATVAFGNGAATLSAPAGWTLIQPSNPGTEEMRTRAWYKVAGPSESGPYVFNASGSADEMLVDIASFTSSAGTAVLGWDLDDSSYNYSTVADTTINSNSVRCVDSGLLYFAGSYNDSEDVVSRPVDMVTSSEQKKTSGAQQLSLATYYQMRDAGNGVVKTIEWNPSAEFLAAIAAVFSCQSVEEYTIDTIVVGSGSISPTGPVNVMKDGSITFSIIPNSGYQVSDVEVDGSSVGVKTSYTFNKVSADHTLKAYFVASSLFTITTSPGSNGSISPAGPVAVSPGADKAFSIIPDAGYRVDQLVIDGKKIKAATSYTFENVSENHVISATFIVDEAAPPDDSCTDISDVPLDARFNSAPPNILIALDDSGSMSYEILVPGARDGRYLDYFDYVFDNPCGASFGSYGCHEYDRNSILVRGQGRLQWKTQWSGFNKVYYDPTIDYEPWPTPTGNMDNADANSPRAHPMHVSPTFDLGGSFDTVSDGSIEIIADDEDTAIFNKTGDWTEYSGVGGAYNDHYFAARDKAGTYTATWTPYVPGGTYKVYGRWTDPLNDRSDKVPYTIVHAGGTDTVKVDQSSNPGSWILLGTYTFNSGTAKVSIDITLEHDSDPTACADAIKFVPEGNFAIDIPRAHYYVKSATTGKPYLVIVDGTSIDYYEFYDADADDVVDPGELLPSVSPPSDVKSGRSYVEERQNFANWYSYYRRRAYTATYATAELITNMQAVRIGLYGINIGSWYSIVQPVLNIKNDEQDYTETLLNLLYTAQFKGGTPLRRALESAGRYFDATDTKNLDGTADPGNLSAPWDTAENGGECQQSFTIVISDGYYNGNPPKNSAIQNVDGDNGVPYADTYAQTLADVAMYYYERDLNPALANNVPENEYDNAAHQHMVTYSVTFGVVGMNSPDDYDADLKHKTTGDYIVWPNPGTSGQTPEKIDDAWHAAVNGHGQFLNSSNPRELVNALKEVMKNIERRVFSASGVAINGDQLYQRLEPDLLMFQASYSSEGWTGDVKAFKVDGITGEVDTLNPEWSAAEMLDNKSWSSRLLVSYNPDTGAGIPFRSDQFDSLTAVQKALLDPNWETDDTNARNIMDYLHGKTSNEVRYGGALRSRFRVLGDIVHSSPVFKNDILYAGGNDGMLHAFDVGTGEELFAYVPNLVFANLSALANPDYQHQYYVDLTPTIRDVNFSGVNHTMLVGGLGKGGRGYFALDITGFTPTTVPGTEMAKQVMWEYPDSGTLATDIDDLGYSFSRPSVVKSNDSANAPWVVIFGNGYNSANGYAVLLILDAETGTLLKKIDTLVGTCNGLSTPVAIDVDDNNTVDYVYAGDLKGNLWKFDLTAQDYNQWAVAYNELGTPKPLFQTAPGQPITTKPSVMFHCEKNGYMVIFGTGKYLGLGDLDSTGTQAVYGIWDYSDDEDPSEYVGTFNGSLITDTHLPSSVSLLQQTEENDGIANLRTLSDGQPDWKTTKKAGANCGDFSGSEDCDINDIPSVDPEPDPARNVGWYFELPEPGERVISDVQIRAGRLTVISYVAEGSTCGLAGHSWVMVMDPCTGGRLRNAYFDINNDGIIDYQDLVDVEGYNAVPTGIRIEGKVQMPSYLIDGKIEKGFYGKGDTGWEEIVGAAAKQGMTYWRVLRK